MKRIIGLLLAGIILCSLAACAAQNTNTENNTDAPEATAEQLRELNIRAPKKYTEMTAVFSNTGSGDTKEIKMEMSEEDDQSIIFTCEADTSRYNMVHLTYNDTDSMDVAFNSFVSGWNIKGDMLLPYVVGKEPVYDPQFETKVFQFDGRDKKVYIWTPEDYDEKSNEKYSVIYLFDGQSVLTTGIDRGMDNDTACWNVCESVESMMAATPHKAIIVAVDNNDVYRWDELVPDLGEINMEGESADVSADDLTLKLGSAFADFLCDTIMPYVNQNYNVFSDAQHTALAGSSLGGLETFYTVLSHPDKFGTGGVMSATFDMYADKEWTEFLKDKLKMKNAPLLYFYAGSYAADNGDVMETMNNKLVFSKYEDGEHWIEYWRNIFPEFLEAVFTQNVAALEFGVPVKYEDTSDPYEEYLEDLDLDINDIQPGYVYYDNSETQWDEVYAYWWGGPSFNTITKETDYFGEWPGIKMKQIEGTDVYRIIAPFGVTGIIFDSGVTDREVAEGKEAYQTVDLQYSTDLMGKIYKIDLSVEHSTAPGNMKTKHRYPAGDWSDYKE